MSIEDVTSTELEALLEFIRQHRGFDFTGYKRASLERRINKRMRTVGVDGYAEYLDYLQVQPDEFTDLFNTILINVTRFFRDPESWSYLAEQVLPPILAGLNAHDPVRVWNPGCSSGQESCTIAILLAEALGLDACRERVKIYGTDVDEEALSEARFATYDADQLESVPEAYREKYFEKHDGQYVLHKELRRCIIYGRHDLVQDAPISRVVLLVCRNTLMYFNSEAQARILTNFHFALKEGGALLLGRGEMLLTHSDLFAPIELKQRVFRKTSGRNMRFRSQTQTDGARPDVHGLESAVWLSTAAFESSPSAQLVLDAESNLVLANGRARAQFGINNHDLGRPFQDFRISYDPTDLRSRINGVTAERRPASHEDIRWVSPTGDTRFLTIEIIPLFDEVGNVSGVSLTIRDSSREKALKVELDRSRQDLETSHEELESTVEEVETTNEELQSTNEELETMNEELQSTNEELETMNEELQSTNEELEAINNELRRRTGELNDVNAFLEAILSSLQMGVVVVNSDSHVQVWNRHAAELWGLRADEVIGGHFLNLDIGLPVDQLRDPVRDCLNGATDGRRVTLSATNRVGKHIDCTVTCMPLSRRDSDILGAIMLMEASVASQV